MTMWRISPEKDFTDHFANQMEDRDQLELPIDHIQIKQWGAITHPCPDFNGGSDVEFGTWMSNYITHEIDDVITNPCLDLSWTMLIR